MSSVTRYIFTIRVSFPWLKNLFATSLEGTAVLNYTKSLERKIYG
jgi:hypothetical protein